MIRMLLLAGLALAPTAVAAENCTGTPGGGAVRLLVQATGVHSADGEVAFTVYPDDKRRFLAKGGKLLRVRVPARGGTTAACFWLRPGGYAIAQYHDENGDHDFNRTLWAPKEGFGFSNDAPTSIGLPSFAAARFVLPAGGATVRMQMRYRR
ncbi:DUF2141 domain-containing protein [Sphingomonas rubra]|uniref:Uncharacterized conserved protein, DUF2141 family n=1 Tax=Sphingomonas rubra TaxID=634430 RepID=A0A1I5S978_9SPHN|nr:DUF2141 domain-containing protein [Sphingomonas rubra]SFP67262.1 Uncharacterized conserved protein, DUF2141 family [Sphingomonas rubra]